MSDFTPSNAPKAAVEQAILAALQQADLQGDDQTADELRAVLQTLARKGTGREGNFALAEHPSSFRTETLRKQLDDIP